jgi:hypothetical protein
VCELDHLSHLSGFVDGTRLFVRYAGGVGAVVPFIWSAIDDKILYLGSPVMYLNESIRQLFACSLRTGRSFLGCRTFTELSMTVDGRIEVDIDICRWGNITLDCRIGGPRVSGKIVGHLHLSLGTDDLDGSRSQDVWDVVAEKVIFVGYLGYGLLAVKGSGLLLKTKVGHDGDIVMLANWREDDDSYFRLFPRDVNYDDIYRPFRKYGVTKQFEKQYSTFSVDHPNIVAHISRSIKLFKDVFHRAMSGEFDQHDDAIDFFAACVVGQRWTDQVISNSEMSSGGAQRYFGLPDQFDLIFDIACMCATLSSNHI